MIADLRLPIADCYASQSAVSENSELLYESKLYSDSPASLAPLLYPGGVSSLRRGGGPDEIAARLAPLLYSGGVEPTARGRAG